ncbi:MAG: twin-arginine translocase subunit TatC, partial [SAR324 cluster bacterium]|nr:twin-arginine translocase subunit TatC [SAR324 cluster bacterium]
NMDPSPVFTERAPLEAFQNQAPRTFTAPPETINLNCQCSVSQPKLDTGSTMVYIGLPELFFAQMKVAIFAGFFIAFPYLLIELWGFVGPALYGGEKKIYWIFSIFTYLFFIGGALFGYFVVFPFGFDFFLSLAQPGEIMPSLSIGEYLGFAIKLLLAFGFIFEMPLATFILARLGIVTPGIMIRQARVAVLVVFIISAVLTPPDPFTMMLMAGPLILLYLFSIGVCFLGLNRQKAAQRAQGIEIDDDDDEED